MIIQGSSSPGFTIADNQPLIDYAGFSKSSGLYGTPRRVGSLLIGQSDLSAICEQISSIYQLLLKDIRKLPDIPRQIPFDMIRFDAFYDSETKKIKIIEINTRNAGMHEIVEWLDDQAVASRIGIKTFDLNGAIARNQRTIHEEKLGTIERVLFVSAPEIPRWIHLDAIRREYGVEVLDISNYAECSVRDSHIYCRNKPYKAVIKKMAKIYPAELDVLTKKGSIYTLQPKYMKAFGLKDYLNGLNHQTILHSASFDASHISRYQKNKDSLVLKRINLGGSKGIHIGRVYNDFAWSELLLESSKNSTKWVLQEYLQPPRLPIYDQLSKDIKLMPAQLGIFIVPQSYETYDMDIVVKSYAGNEPAFKFDPAGENEDIWFGNTIVSSSI